MSVSTELDDACEKLEKRKANFENELKFLQERKRILLANARMLKEKLVVQELEEKVKTERANVKQLESMVSELSERFKEPPKEDGKPQRKEPTEVMVKAAQAGNQHPKQSEEPQERQQEKRKRRFLL